MLLKERYEGRENEEEDMSSYYIILGKDKILEILGGSTRSHSVENPLWKRLWTCLRTD
jgi:hypothetical protein